MKLLTHKRIHHPVARHRVEQILDVFDPMFEPVGETKEEQEKYVKDRRDRFYNSLRDNRETYAEAVLSMCEQALDYYQKHWKTRRERELEEVEIDPRFNQKDGGERLN